MSRLSGTGVLAILHIVAFSVAGCGGGTPIVTPEDEPPPEPRVVQPGAPGEASRTYDGASLQRSQRPVYTDADVTFMQGMIHHHAQALEMSELVASRSQNEAIQRLAHRIKLSQDDEITQMVNWLRDRDQNIPAIQPTLGGDDDHARHGHHHGRHDSDDHALMPGMLSPDQMQQLVDASGDDFDRLFLEYMIMHHEGALVMVEQLFNHDGAGQETDVFAFASHVDSDQRTEILRMRRMLNALSQSSIE